MCAQTNSGLCVVYWTHGSVPPSVLVSGPPSVLESVPPSVPCVLHPYLKSQVQTETSEFESMAKSTATSIAAQLHQDCSAAGQEAG